MPSPSVAAPGVCVHCGTAQFQYTELPVHTSHSGKYMGAAPPSKQVHRCLKCGADYPAA